jgi:hypothetical protein
MRDRPRSRLAPLEVIYSLAIENAHSPLASRPFSLRTRSRDSGPPVAVSASSTISNGRCWVSSTEKARREPARRDGHGHGHE